MADRVCEVFSNPYESYHTYCYQCLTCGAGMETMPYMCETCRDTCHAGHNTSTDYYKSFVCGCGSGEYPGACQASGAESDETLRKSATLKKNDEVAAIAISHDAAAEARTLREKNLEIIEKLPVWKRPAFLGHFCDVALPSVPLDKAFDDEVLMVNQCIDDLMGTVDHASTARRAALSMFDDSEVKSLSKAVLFLTSLKSNFSEQRTSINWTTQAGVSKFLLKLTTSLQELKSGDVFPFMHPNHKHVIFVAERAEKSFTFVISTLDKTLLAFHPFSLESYPKIKYQNCLRISDIDVDKFLDPSTWTLLFCFKQFDNTLIYQILVPFFMEGRVHEDGKLQGETAEVKHRLDFYQTQPRSENYVFYRSLLTVLRYYIRTIGISPKQAKQLFHVLRVAYLDRIANDLVPLAKTEISDKVLITAACDQAFRSVEKCQFQNIFGRTESIELKKFTQVIMSTVMKKLETDVEKSNGFSLSSTTPFAHFHGFGFVGDSHSTQHFVDGPIEIIPEVFTDLAPAKQTLESFRAVFDTIQQTRSRCYIMRAKASSSSDAVVAHQIVAMIHHAFTEVIPLPSPRATPVAIFKCPYSTAKDVKLDIQRETLRSLLDIMQEFVAASLACEFSNSQNHATRCIIAGCILAVFDAVIRMQASPIPSPVSVLLCSEQLISVFASNLTKETGSNAGDTVRKSRTVSCKGYWLPDFDLENKTSNFPVRDPRLLRARDAVLRYFKHSQEAKSPHLFAWTNPPEKKQEATKAEAKDEGPAGEAKGDNFDDLFAGDESFDFSSPSVSKIEVNNSFLVKSGDYTVDFVNKLLTNVHESSGGSNNSLRSDLSGYASALITNWERENVPEFAYYRDVVIVYLLGLQYTGRDTQQNLYPSDVRPSWSCRDSENGCVIAMSLSNNLTFGEPPKNKALCATYKLEATEEKLLHQDIDTKIFGDSLNLEEVERLASYLTVEYLRIPLVLEFFSQDRCAALTNPVLRELLDAVLFEPLAFVTDVKTVMTIPVPETRKAEYLGTQFGVLMEEVIHAPLAILGPLSCILQGSIKLCAGNYTSSSVPVLMYAVRLALSVTSFFYEGIEVEQLHRQLSDRVRIAVEEVEQGLVKCEGMLNTWIAEAMNCSDKKRANEFHVHLVLIHGARRAALTRDSVANFLGSGAFAISMYHRNMNLINIPIQDLFLALQRQRLAVLNYSESCLQNDLEVVLDRIVETAIGQAPEKGKNRWDSVMQERPPRVCEYRVATSHPYEVGTDFYTPVAFPGVERIALFFDELTALNPGDFITIYQDETHSSYWGSEARIFGSGPWPGAGGRDPLIIPAEGFILYFHSHKQISTTKWGFELVARARLSPVVVDQLVQETNLPRIVCFSALADANHDVVKAKEVLIRNGGLSTAATQQLEADSAPRKLSGLYSNRDRSLQINIQTCELYMHKFGSLRELPIQFSNTEAFERVFKTRDNSNFRCSIKAHDRNRQVVIFNHTDPATGYNCFYEVEKWDRPKISKDTRSLFDTLTLLDRQASGGAGVLINREVFEADLDGLAEKGYFNMPTRDDAGLRFLGQRFITYTSKSCGWLSTLFDAVVKKFEGSKPSIAMVWISEHTLNLFNAAKALEEKMQGLKAAEAKKLEVTKVASKTVKQEAKKEVGEAKDQPTLVEKAGYGPAVPTVNGVIGSMLMFCGRPGNFFQVDVLGDRNLHIYLLFEHGRKCQRRFVYATDARSAFFHDVPSLSENPNDPVNRAPAEAPFSSGTLYQLRDSAESLVISRDAGPFREPRLGEEDKETFYNDEFFEGLIPACLIAEYDFWKTGPFSFRGYPKASTGETQLLIILQLQVCIRLNNGEFVTVNAEPQDTGDIVRQRAAKKLGVADWERIPAFTSRGQALASNAQVFEAGLFELGARVSRLPFALDKQKVKQIKGEIKGEPPLLLLNMVRCATDSALGKIAQLLRHLEDFSHICVWSKSAAKTDSEECEVSLMELPRLRISFVAKQVDGEIRLYSQEYDGLYIDTSFDDVYNKWVGDIPHALVLKNGNKESFLLIPNYGLKRLQLDGSVFPTKLVRVVSGDWAKNVNGRFFMYPVHSSGEFLVTSSTGALLYLIVTHLMTMEYAKCGQLLENCVIEEKLTPEESYVLTLVKAAQSDQHPDACALRLKLALLCILSDNKPPFEFADDYKLYLKNSSHVSSPFRISAEHELKLDPSGARKKWLHAVATNQDTFDIWHRRPPQNTAEIFDFIRRFVVEFNEELSGYEDLREVIQKHLLAKADMNVDEVTAFWSKDWPTLKSLIKTGFDALYTERETLARTQGEGEDREPVVVRKDATEDMNRILVKVLRGYFTHLKSFQEEPAVATAAKYATFVQNLQNEVKNGHFDNPISFKTPKPWTLQGDNAVRGVVKLLFSHLSRDNFVMVYQMLMGHIQPDLLPAKDDSQTEDEAATDRTSKFAHRHPPRSLNLIRLILRAVAVTTGGNLQTSYLTILLHAVERGDTSLFPSYPTDTFSSDQAGLPLYEKFQREVQAACQEYVRRGNWTIPEISYLDLHPAKNYEPVKVPMQELKNEFQPAVIRDMSCSSHRAIPVKHELEALNLTSSELNVFATQPLNVGTIFQKNILVEVSKNSGDVDDLPWTVDKDSLSPCEEEVIDQMQQDLINSSRGDSSDSRLSYLNPKHIQILHHSIADTNEAKASGDVLATALAHLDTLQKDLETLRDGEARLVRQGRVNVEEIANKGTAQLVSARLKFEFLVAALLQPNSSLAEYNSKLTLAESDLVFSCLIGVCLRSIRLAQTKLALVNLAKLRSAIHQFLSSRLEAKWSSLPEGTASRPDNLPIPTRSMVSHCLEAAKFMENNAHSLLTSLLKEQQSLATTLESEQKLDKEDAEKAANIMIHLAKFNVKNIESKLDGKNLIDWGNRGCYFRGSTLNHPTLSQKENSAAGMSFEAMVHVIQATSQALADVLAERRSYMHAARPKQVSIGAPPPPPRPPSHVFDPRFLVFEYSVNFMVRKRQVELVLSFVDAATAKKPRSCVNQMIMGSGKTTVIAPLLSLILANGDNLIMLVIPKPLLDMGLSVMRNLFSNIIKKKVIVYDFDRSINDEAEVRRKYLKLKKARIDQSIVCCTPEAIKASMLKYIDLLEETRASNPALYIPKKHFCTHYLWEQVGKLSEDITMLTKTADAIADILCLWREKGVALLDEVDTLLHPLRSELNFPIGKSQRLDMVENGDRYLYPIFLYDAFFFAHGKRTCEDSEHKILLELTSTIKRGTQSFAFQTFPHPILLQKGFYKESIAPLMARWSYIWTSKQPAMIADAKKLNAEEMETNILAYTTTRRIGDYTDYVAQNFSQDSIKYLNLARDWITIFFPYTISKINRVDYGLLQQSYLEVWQETQSESRLLMAVPFVGKDVPSRHSEFANPEVLIGLSILSYHYEGLRNVDLKKIVQRLKESMKQEPGSFIQRPSRIRFNDWINLYELVQRREKKKFLKILPLELFPPDMDSQALQVLSTAFGNMPEIIDFWLTQVAFPETLKYQLRKLQASGMDLGSDILFKTRLGFSGTPSNILPIDFGKCGFEPGCQAQIVRVMVSPKFTKFSHLQSGWTVVSLLTFVAQHNPPFHALIDTGALVTGFSNKEVAEFLLRVGLGGMECCVYLNDADQKMVLNRAGDNVPFNRSGVAPERRFTFFDQAHTTGMDIKQTVDACAATTLGKDMTLRDHSQGIYRMRGLGNGQTVHLLVIPQVLDLIFRVVSDDRRNDQHLLVNVVHWLTDNGLRSFNQQYLALCQQNLNNMYRKEAFRAIVESRQPIADERFVTQNRFCYCAPTMTEKEASELLEKNPLMSQAAFLALLSRYDITVTVEVTHPSGLEGLEAEYTLQIENESMLLSNMVSTLMDMVASDIVNSTDLQVMLTQGNIKYTIVDDFDKEIKQQPTKPLKLKDIDTVCHPKRARLSEVKRKDKKAKTPEYKDAPVEPRNPDEKTDAQKVKKFREFPHISVKLQTSTKDFALFAKHFQPKGARTTKAVEGVLANANADDTFLDAKTMEAEELMALLAKMTPAERKKWNRDEKIRALEAPKGEENNAQQEENPLTIFKELAPMTPDRFRWLRRCLLLFCEDVVLDVETHVTRPKKFSTGLQNLACERDCFIASDGTFEQVDMVIDQVVRTENAILRNLVKLTKAAEDEGQNLDTELVQQSEQEQEAIQQTVSGAESRIKYAPVEDGTYFWSVMDLSSASCMLDNNFYPLDHLEEIQPMRYPPYVLLSQNYLKKTNLSVNRRRLKNVYVLALWEPKHNGYDADDHTDQLLALLEREAVNPAQMLRDEKAKAKKRKAESKVADDKPETRQKPYIIALSLQEAESLRRVIQMFMGPNAPSSGGFLLDGTKISLASLNGLWLTDEIVRPGAKSKPMTSQLFLEPGYQVNHFDLGRQCLRFFNCSMDLTKDDVILLIHSLEGQTKEVRKKSYAQAIESRRRVRKTYNGTNLEQVFLADVWDHLARSRDLSVRVLEAMKSNKMSFSDIDKNGDGILSRDEFVAALQQLPGLHASEEMLTELLSYVDENDDGMVNYREFCAIFLGVEDVSEVYEGTNSDEYFLQVEEEEEVTLGTSKQRKNSVLVPFASKQAITGRAVEPRAAHEVWEWPADLGQPYLRSGGSAQLGFDDLLMARPEVGTLTVALRGVKLYQNSYYFEARIVQPGAGVIGVIDECFVVNNKTGLGGPGSWGFNGKLGCLYSNGVKLPSSHKWLAGDVVGVHINLSAKEIVFSLNGVSEFSIKGVSFQGSLCPAASFNSTFSAYLNTGTQPMVHQPASTQSVMNWVKIKMETVYALQTGHFFSVESNAPFKRLMNTKMLYELASGSTNFRQGIMLEGNWYYEFTLMNGVCEKNDFVLGQQVYNEQNSNTWTVAEYDNSETRNVLSKEGAVLTNFAVRDTVSVAYNCEEGVVTMAVNGKWVKKSYFNRKHRILHGHRPLFKVVSSPTATISMNFGHLPFKYCASNFKSVLEWLNRMDVFKNSNESGEEVTKVDDMVNEQYETKLDEERAEISGLKTDVSSSGGVQIKLQVRTGQCAVTLSPSFNEEAKTKIQVHSTQAYPTVVAGDVNLTMGMWYYEIHLDSVAALDRAVFGWIHSNFVPDSRTGVGVGDAEFTWGLQLQTTRSNLPLKFFHVNEKNEKKRPEVRAGIERNHVKDVPDYAETIMDDIDAEEIVVEEEKVEEQKVEKKAADAVKVSKGSLIRTDSQVWESKDVIGCAIDFTNKLMSFSRNGDWNPRWRIRFSTHGLRNQALRPAFSLSTSVRTLTVFFGNIDNPEKQFIHPAPNFHFALNLCLDKRILNHFSGGVACTLDESALNKASPLQIGAKAAIEAEVLATDKVDPLEMTDENEDDILNYKYAANETEEGKKMILWDLPRKYRKKWRQYLQAVSKIEIVENSGNSAPHLNIFGDMWAKAPDFRRQIFVFLSSSFTDTQVERDLLILDVHPYLRELASMVGFQYAAFEMRWGIREEAANSHATSQICEDAVQRCVNDSQGIAYVAILGNKYGYRPFPADMPDQEFKLFCSKLPTTAKALLEKWFEPDHNAVPLVYNLRALDTSELKKEWWGSGPGGGAFGILQKELRLAAHHLPQARASRYVVSNIEVEVCLGLMNFDKREDLMKSFCFTRRFGQSAPQELKREDKIAPKFIDFVDDAQSLVNSQIRRVEEKLKKANLKSRFREYHLEYDPAAGISLKRHKMYLRSFANHYCQLVCESLLVAARRHASLASDALLEEVTTHTSMALRQSSAFVGRVPESEAIMAYIHGSSRQPFVVCGNSGSGKTALMAKASLMCGEIREYFMIVRFLGMGLRSSSAAGLMRNLCIHLGRIYGKPDANVPFTYSSLKSTLKEYLNFPTHYCPLVIFLDGLDQLTDEDQGRELGWLPEKLPKHVRLIVSCVGDEPKYKNTPTSAPYRSLTRRNYPANTWLHVLPLSTVNSNAMLDTLLSNANRTLTAQQHDIVSAAFGKSESSRLPLYVRLMYTFVFSWRSTTIPPPFPSNITDIIRHTFSRLEKDHGKVAPAALSYITCSKFGLSTDELEDVLSLDDEVLNDVFQWWSPPLRRIPPVLWMRLRTDIREYLVERGAQGVAVQTWFHRQFKEVVLEMWGSEPAVLRKRHNLLAEYFSGIYASGKEVMDAKGQVGPVLNRHINPQKLILLRTKTMTRYNLRRLAELPHHLIHSGRWDRLVGTLCNFEFMTAQCEVSSINQLVSDFTESIEILQQQHIPGKTASDAEALQTLQEYKNFLVQHSRFIGLQPQNVYNLARNMPEKSAACRGATEWFEALDEKRRNPWLKQIYRPQAIYPGITELQCPSLVSAVALSPDNKRVAVLFGADQLSLKIYESLSFEEIAEFKFSRTSSKTEAYEDPVQNFYHQEEIDWFGDRIVLMLDTVFIVHVISGTLTSCPPCDFKLLKCQFSHDGSRLVCQGNGCLVIYDSDSGAILNHWENIIYGALSPSNNVLAYVEKPKPALGDNVRAAWKAGGSRFPAFIVAVNKDGSYFVQFEDGDFDRECPLDSLDLLQDQSALKILDATKVDEAGKRQKSQQADGGYGSATAKTGALERFGRIDRTAVKRPEGVNASSENENNYADYALSVAWSSTSQLAAVLASGEVLLFNLDERGMQLKKCTLARNLVISKSLSCAFSRDAKWLFVLSANSFHFVEASSGLVSGILAQDYMWAVVNAKFFTNASYCISLGGANRAMKLWDLNVVWDHAFGKKLIDRVMAEEKKAKSAAAERMKAGEKKTNEDWIYTTKERAIGHPLELDVDAQWSPDGKSLIFLSIDLSAGNPVSVIKTLLLAELEAALDANGQREVTVRKLELPVAQADDPNVTFTVTKVDRAPACLAWSPSGALHVISGVAYLGVPRPKTFGMEVGLELRKRDGIAITSLRPGSNSADPIAIKFSPDSQYLAGAFERNDFVCLWQLLSADKTMTKLSANGFIRDFVFSKDSQYLLCATSTHLMYIKIATQQSVASLAITASCSVAMSFEPHKYVAVGTETGSVTLYQLDFVPNSSNMAFTHLHTWQVYGPEHASQKIFGVGFIRNTGILVTIGDSVVKIWHCGGPKIKPKEIARYHARFLLAKMALSEDGVIVLFGHRGIDPLILAVESLGNYIDTDFSPVSAKGDSPKLPVTTGFNSQTLRGLVAGWAKIKHRSIDPKK